MGAMAEAMVAYAQPLIDQTDGSHAQMNKALVLSSLCYNIGIIPESERPARIRDMQASLGMDANEFKDFCNSIVYPMLERFDEMFPNMNRGLIPSVSLAESSNRSRPMTVERPKKSAEPLPYAACPCNSGKKFKFCCKQTRTASANRF